MAKNLAAGRAGIRAMVPVHMVDEFGHVTGIEEVPMTPHHTNVHTPIGSPAIRGAVGNTIEEHLNHSFTSLAVSAVDESAVPIYEKSSGNLRGRLSSNAGEQRSVDFVESITSLPVPRNPPGSLADGVSHASNHSSSISSWMMPRNGENSPVETLAASEVNKDIAGRLKVEVERDIDAFLENPSNVNRYFTSLLAVQNSRFRPSTSLSIHNDHHSINVIDPASTPTTSRDTSSTMATNSNTREATPLDNGSEASSTNQFSASEKLRLVMKLKAGVVARVQHQYYRLELQSKRCEGNAKITRYGTMLQQIDDCTDNYDLGEKLLKWGFAWTGNDDDKNKPVDSSAYQEARSAIVFLRELTTKRMQDLAVAQTVVEEKLESLEDETYCVALNALPEGNIFVNDYNEIRFASMQSGIEEAESAGIEAQSFLSPQNLNS